MITIHCIIAAADGRNTTAGIFQLVFKLMQINQCGHLSGITTIRNHVYHRFNPVLDAKINQGKQVINVTMHATIRNQTNEM